MKKVNFKYIPGDDVIYMHHGIRRGKIKEAFYDESQSKIFYKLEDNLGPLPEDEIYPSIEKLLANFKKILTNLKNKNNAAEDIHKDK